jgi:hypothetical protein
VRWEPSKTLPEGLPRELRFEALRRSEAVMTVQRLRFRASPQWVLFAWCDHRQALLVHRVRPIALGEYATIAVAWNAYPTEIGGTTGEGGRDSDGGSTSTGVPETCSNPSDFAVQQVSAGSRFMCVLTVGGNVRCKGDDYLGQLGDGHTKSGTTALGSDVLTGVQAVSAGDDHTCAGPLSGETLRNMTCGWWSMSRATAAHVRYVVGVYDHQVVSVYETAIPSADWPALPRGVPDSDEGRLFIPAYPLHLEDGRRRALAGRNPPQFNAAGFRYGTLTFNDAGEITGYQPGA